MVRAEMPNGENIIGRAVAVEPDGQLVVLDDCAVSHRINTADVVHLRPATD
jgi:BirA family biotin operon repressor/biotin-[acetyl-CoA-carboxylase] ligase